MCGKPKQSLPSNSCVSTSDSRICLSNPKSSWGGLFRSINDSIVAALSSSFDSTQSERNATTWPVVCRKSKNSASSAQSCQYVTTTAIIDDTFIASTCSTYQGRTMS